MKKYKTNLCIQSTVTLSYDNKQKESNKPPLAIIKQDYMCPVDFILFSQTNVCAPCTRAMYAKRKRTPKRRLSFALPPRAIYAYKQHTHTNTQQTNPKTWSNQQTGRSIIDKVQWVFGNVCVGESVFLCVLLFVSYLLASICWLPTKKKAAEHANRKRLTNP